MPEGMPEDFIGQDDAAAGLELLAPIDDDAGVVGVMTGSRCRTRAINAASRSTSESTLLLDDVATTAIAGALLATLLLMGIDACEGIADCVVGVELMVAAPTCDRALDGLDGASGAAATAASSVVAMASAGIATRASAASSVAEALTIVALLTGAAVAATTALCCILTR